MEKYFDIRYEFDVPTVHAVIDEYIAKGKTGYICVADGNILTMVHNDEEYRTVIDGSIFSICDSSWVPKFVKWIYGYKRGHYCGSDIFIDVVRARKHRMIFLGTKQNVLDALQQNLTKENPDVAGMTFKELPFCTVNEFDYAGIAKMIEQDGADIIWVALGAPKQEIFMSLLQPHLKRGVMFGFGAIFNFNAGVGEVKRAPQWMLNLRLEWLHRAFEQPQKNVPRYWNFIKILPRLIREERKKIL